MQFRSVYHPSHSETLYFTIICDALTKLLHLLKMDSLGYKNQKLMLWGFGLVPFDFSAWQGLFMHSGEGAYV